MIVVYYVFVALFLWVECLDAPGLRWLVCKVKR